MFSWGNTTQDLLTFSPAMMALALILMENSISHILNILLKAFIKAPKIHSENP